MEQKMNLSIPSYYVVIIKEKSNGEKKAYYESGPYHSLAEAIDAKQAITFTQQAAVAQVDIPLTLLF